MFTIVICTYNGEKYIRKCIETLLCLNSLEVLTEKILVVDNNSKDNTKQIVEKIIEKNDIVSYEFEPKQGLSYARAHAAKVNTDWVIYVDDDNFLDENWLIELKYIIDKNEKVGVVNGAIIAKPEEGLNESELNCLKVIYRDLACTHLDDDFSKKVDNNNPIGAGLCVKTAALKEIYRNGWLSLVGRQGNTLFSGEDGELCLKIFNQGYKYYFSTNMKLYHAIPKSRLNINYVEKLIEGLVNGRIKFLRMQRFGKFKCYLRKVKYQIMFIYYTLVKKDSSNNIGSYDYWKRKIKFFQIRSYINSL